MRPLSSYDLAAAETDGIKHTPGGEGTAAAPALASPRVRTRGEKAARRRNFRRQARTVITVFALHAGSSAHGDAVFVGRSRG